MLPSTTKVSQLYSFFEKYIRESNRNKNMNMIVKNLLKANQRQVSLVFKKLLTHYLTGYLIYLIHSRPRNN